MGQTYEDHASNTGLHLFQSDAVFHTDHLLLHRDHVLQTLKHDIGEVSDQRKAVIGSVGDEGVKNFVSCSTKLVVCILSESAVSA